MSACAYVVGSDTGSGAALHALARNLGFDTVLPFGGIAEADRRAREVPLSFFLFAEVSDVATLSPAAQAIRFSRSLSVRFSPLIYFSKYPSLAAIRQCIGMGFDDIITAPFSIERVGGRLSRQVGTDLAFFETPDYFGPDRRRGEAAAPEDRRGGQFRRIVLRRDPDTGVNVLDDGEQVML